MGERVSQMSFGARIKPAIGLADERSFVIVARARRKIASPGERVGVGGLSEPIPDSP